MAEFNYTEYLKNNPLLKEQSKNSIITESMDEKEVEEVMGVDSKGNKKPDTEVSNLSKAKTAIRTMKVSELKAKIKEDIMSLLQEADEEEDVELEDEVEIEDEAEIEAEPSMEEPAGEGLSADEQEIQNSLKMAYDNAVAIGDQKLADQIGNSITFFTRTHVVER